MKNKSKIVNEKLASIVFSIVIIKKRARFLREVLRWCQFDVSSDYIFDGYILRPQIKSTFLRLVVKQFKKRHFTSHSSLIPRNINRIFGYRFNLTNLWPLIGPSFCVDCTDFANFQLADNRRGRFVWQLAFANAYLKYQNGLYQCESVINMNNDPNDWI